MTDSNYYALYTAAATLIPQGSKVIELGCGYGPFMPYVEDKAKSYVGVDIDKLAIQQAELLLTTSRRKEIVKFVKSDVMKVDYSTCQGRTFVALEVFEHLKDDLKLLEKLPKGVKVIFSVPSFDSHGHKRFFPEEHEAIERYSTKLDIDFWRKIRIPTGAGYFHLMRGNR